MFDITNLPEEIIKEIFCFFDLNLFYKLTLQNKEYLKLKTDKAFWNFYFNFVAVFIILKIDINVIIFWNIF